LNPAILYYTSNTSAVDYDLDGTYNREMRIRVGVSIDPDAVGNVNHTLYLINASDDSVVKVIKANFTSANDSDVDVWFNTTDVPDYDRYTFKVVATCANDSTDTQSFQANSNFTIRNELGVGSISEANITLICPSDKQEIETDFTISWVVSVSGSVNNYISNVSEPSGCWYVSGADNDTNTTLGGTITNSSTYQCGAIATYTFALNITYTNATGTYTINKTCNITTKSKTGSGGGSPTTPTAEVNFTLIPDVLLPRNSQTMFQQQRADFSLTVRNYKDAFLGKIIFELVPTDELGQNEFATDGWCELVDTFYQNYIYPENSTTTNINIKCELPQFDWGKEQAWYEKVCVKADNGEKKCSLLKISSKKADREVETDLIERILELLSVYWFPVILLISLLIVVIWYGKRKKRKK